MGNKGSKSNYKLTVANASVYDIYVKLVPESSCPPVKAQSKRLSCKKNPDNSSEAHFEELTVEAVEKDSFVVINPCNSYTFPCLEAANFLSVEADDGIGHRIKISEMIVDTKCNQIFAYTMMKRSKKGKVWIDKEDNNYKTHFENIRNFLKIPDSYRRQLKTRIKKLNKELIDAQLSNKELNKTVHQTVITMVKRNPDCSSCNQVKDRIDTTKQQVVWEGIKEAVNTNECVCKHVSDLKQNKIFKKKMKMEEDFTKKKSEIEQLENIVKLDDKALSSEADFEGFKEKRKKQLNILILPKQN